MHYFSYFTSRNVLLKSLAISNSITIFECQSTTVHSQTLPNYCLVELITSYISKVFLVN